MRETPSTQCSRIFRPYRVIGMIANDTSFSMYRLGDESFITVAVGRTFQVYDCKRLRLRCVGRPVPDDIEFLATVVLSSGPRTIASCGNKEIYIWKGAEIVNTIAASAPVSRLLSFGEQFLVIAGNQVELYNARDGVLENRFPVGSGEVTSIMHPPTYVNKIVVGYSSGKLELYNLRTGKLVYAFQNLRIVENEGISCITESPALDIVAIGFDSGRIVVHNLRLDKTLVTFDASSQGGVTCLSFRNDSKKSQLVAASSMGHMTVWDLDSQRLHTTMIDVHAGNITSLQFMQGEPIMISGAKDNSLKMWIFDTADDNARLLKSREGHADVPNKIRFDSEGKNILSCARDQTLRVSCVYRDEQSTELSQKQYRKTHNGRNLPEISDFAWSASKLRHWDSLVTIHSKTKSAYTWNLNDKVLGKHCLTPDDNGTVTSVAMSACGNFALIGTSRGGVYKYNMQSGFLRGTIVAGKDRASPIVGLGVDSCNKFVTLVTLEGHVGFFCFNTSKFLGELILKEMVTCVTVHADSGCIAIACDDRAVRVVDMVNTHKVVRTFKGSSGAISDVCFSNDGRWSIVSCADGSVRVYDIPSSCLIDCFRFSHPVTSICMAPQGDFLATTHAENLGIYLWANRSYYSNLYPKVVDNSPIDMDLPVVTEEGASESPEGDMDTPGCSQFSVVGLLKADTDLAELSDLPRTHWETLSNIQSIKERNQPKQLVETAPEAPFFLPTIPGVEPKLDSSVILERPGDAPLSNPDAMPTQSLRLDELLPLKDCMYYCALNVLLTISREPCGYLSLVSFPIRNRC